MLYKLQNSLPFLLGNNSVIKEAKSSEPVQIFLKKKQDPIQASHAH